MQPQPQHTKRKKMKNENQKINDYIPMDRNPDVEYNVLIEMGLWEKPNTIEDEEYEENLNKEQQYNDWDGEIESIKVADDYMDFILGDNENSDKRLQKDIEEIIKYNFQNEEE